MDEWMDLFVENLRFRDIGPSIGIQYQGRFIRLRSGKAVWGSIGAAKNALHAHLQSIMPWRRRGNLEVSERDFYTYLVENGIVEFVPVTG